jgi:hypothetical protein
MFEESTAAMIIRRVSGAGMDCLFRCLVIIIGLAGGDPKGGASALRQKLADFIESNPDHQVGNFTGETFAIRIQREFNMSVPTYCTAMRDQRKPMMGGTIEIEAFVILYPNIKIVTCFKETMDKNSFMPRESYGTPTPSEQTFHLLYSLAEKHYDFLEPEKRFTVKPTKLKPSPVSNSVQTGKNSADTPEKVDRIVELSMRVSKLEEQVVASERGRRTAEVQAQALEVQVGQKVEPRGEEVGGESGRPVDSQSAFLKNKRNNTALLTCCAFASSFPCISLLPLSVPTPPFPQGGRAEVVSRYGGRQGRNAPRGDGRQP